MKMDSKIIINNPNLNDVLRLAQGKVSWTFTYVENFEAVSLDLNDMLERFKRERTVLPTRITLFEYPSGSRHIYMEWK